MVAYQAYLKVPGNRDLQREIANHLLGFDNRIVEEAFESLYHKYPFLHVLGRAFFESDVKSPLEKINAAFEASGKYGLTLDLASVLKSPFKEGKQMIAWNVTLATKKVKEMSLIFYLQDFNQLLSFFKNDLHFLYRILCYFKLV